MKKSIFFLILIALTVTACADKASESKANSKLDTAPIDNGSQVIAQSEADIPGLTGFYVGEFQASKFHEGKNPSYSNRINISIDKIGEEKVSGHSVVAGNSRAFSGTYTMENGTYKVEASEPGDDKYDGKFSFVLDPSKKTVKGTWTANDPKITVYVRNYTLEAKTFHYDPNYELPEDVASEYLYSNQDEFQWNQGGEHLSEDVLKFNPSKVKLKKEDIQNMYKGDLEIMRNSIYARHGYSFKTRKMRFVFDSIVEWYIPVSTDVSKELTKLEEENIAILKRYEEHAETYYDSFGR